VNKQIKRPTRNDVAAYAGVSVATVSYVVNNGPRTVSEETRQRVLEAIKALGYRPHAIARSLKTGNTQTIGLLVQSLIPTFIAHLVNAVEDSLAKWGYGLILASTHEDCDRERHMLQVLADQSIDGLLYIPTTCANSDIVTRLIEQGLPVVFMDRCIAGVPADAVMTDNVCAAKTAVEYLIQQGCQKIVCLSFSKEASSALERIEGYRQAIEEHGLGYDNQNVLLIRYAKGESVEPALLAYIDKFGIPDGILCTTDSFVIETMKTLRQCSIKVPDQVRLVGGFDRAEWSSLLEPPIPFIMQDFELIAQRAVEFLMERIDGKEYAPRTELISAEFDWLMPVILPRA
jgi:LacI family transcriptional regulator